MDEIAGSGLRGEFPALAPAHLAGALEHVGDGLLLAMVMNSGPPSRLDDEDSAPQRGLDTARRRDRRRALRARRLRGTAIELRRTDDRDREIFAHAEQIGRQADLS